MANHQACTRDCGSTDPCPKHRAQETAYPTAPFRVLQERTCCDGLCQQGRHCPRTAHHDEEGEPATAREAAGFYALLVVLLIVLIGIVSATVLVLRDPAGALQIASHLLATIGR